MSMKESYNVNWEKFNSTEIINFVIFFTRHKPYVLILLLAAPSWAAAVTKLQYGWAATIFGSIFELRPTPVTQQPYGWTTTIFGSNLELSIHKKLPLDTSQALSTHSTLGRSQLSCSCYPAAIWMGGHYFWKYFWAQQP